MIDWILAFLTVLMMDASLVWIMDWRLAYLIDCGFVGFCEKIDIGFFDG